MPDSPVCTLFEHHYHYGVGALVNSLFRHGYRGIIWAGYRGPLPVWAAAATASTAGYTELAVGEGCAIRFIPVQTERHLTNYKPAFLTDLWKTHCPEAAALFYFDPDIVIKCAWSFFEEWVNYGVALCEDVNSPMLSSHPIRHVWRRFCKEHGVVLTQDLDNYVSGGFVGLRRDRAAFLDTWETLIVALQAQLGDLKHLAFSDRPFAFYTPDQDVLNMTLMATAEPLSLMGKEGMDFINGGYTMSHAAGAAKPWRKQMLASALRGIPPTLPDKGYWQNVTHPIRLYSDAEMAWHKLDLLAGSAVGLVVRRA